MKCVCVCVYGMCVCVCVCVCDDALKEPLVVMKHVKKQESRANDQVPCLQPCPDIIRVRLATQITVSGWCSETKGIVSTSELLTPPHAS